MMQTSVSLCDVVVREQSLCGVVVREQLLCGVVVREQSLCGVVVREQSLCGVVVREQSLCGVVVREQLLCGVVVREQSLCGVVVREQSLCGVPGLKPETTYDVLLLASTAKGFPTLDESWSWLSHSTLPKTTAGQGRASLATHLEPCLIYQHGCIWGE